VTINPLRFFVVKNRHQNPANYDPTEYPTFAVTVDIVIFTMLDGQLQVLLVKRDADPYVGMWALPGGFKRPDENLDQAAERELREETGVLSPGHLTQLRAYGEPGRDPRTNVVTVAYLAALADVGRITAGSDAADAQLWPVRRALESLELAFDHDRILIDALSRSADELEQTNLATAFLQPTFTLSELQSVYEEIWGVALDPANFQRSVKGSTRGARNGGSHVVGTGGYAVSSTRGGRPPELYRVGPGWADGPPLRRPRNL
jgi:8-oxo-dGTP diphosphatase